MTVNGMKMTVEKSQLLTTMRHSDLQPLDDLLQIFTKPEFEKLNIFLTIFLQ